LSLGLHGISLKCIISSTIHSSHILAVFLADSLTFMVKSMAIEVKTVGEMSTVTTGGMMGMTVAMATTGDMGVCPLGGT